MKEGSTEDQHPPHGTNEAWADEDKREGLHHQKTKHVDRGMHGARVQSNQEPGVCVIEDERIGIGISWHRVAND